MSLIMLITATPALQAEAFSTSLNMEEFKALSQEIDSAIAKAETPNPDPYMSYDGIPDVETLRLRYQLALKNYEEGLKKNYNKEAEEEAEKYFNALQERAEKDLEQNPDDYQYYRTTKEQSRAAFYSTLYKEMKQAALSEEKLRKDLMAKEIIFCSGFAVGMFITVSGILLFEKMTSTATAMMIGGALVMVLALLFYTKPASTSYFGNVINAVRDPSLSIDPLRSKFLDDPFWALAQFGRGGVDDFSILYKENQRCAQILWDVVDIEFYTSMNTTLDNMKDRIYTQTADWSRLSMQDQEAYLHNLAERLRAESNQKNK